MGWVFGQSYRGFEGLAVYIGYEEHVLRKVAIQIESGEGRFGECGF